jgi:copper chaperone CopZ
MKKKIYIDGMSCEHCVKRVEKTLNSIEGLKNVKVKIGLAEVETSSDINDLVFKNSIEDIGYDVTKIE